MVTTLHSLCDYTELQTPLLSSLQQRLCQDSMRSFTHDDPLIDHLFSISLSSSLETHKIDSHRTLNLYPEHRSSRHL